MPSKKSALRLYCSTEEKTYIEEQAIKSGLSISRYGKRILLAHEVPNRTDQEARRELLKINADIARLGGLLKMALANGIDGKEIYTLIKEITMRQVDLKDAIKCFLLR